MARLFLMAALLVTQIAQLICPADAVRLFASLKSGQLPSGNKVNHTY